LVLVMVRRHVHVFYHGFVCARKNGGFLIASERLRFNNPIFFL
jgi:hypothetical protein